MKPVQLNAGPYIPVEIIFELLLQIQNTKQAPCRIH